MVVIGAGAGGLVTAAGSAGVGGRVAIIEEHLMGGDCLNVGCVPSKALIRCARAAHEVGKLYFLFLTRFITRRETEKDLESLPKTFKWILVKSWKG